jgi:sugar phosphate isomerase/epimerase
LEIGLYTDSLGDLAFDRALDVAADAGLRAIEIATGGQSAAPHLRLDELLASPARRRRFQAAFAERGLRIAALNCSAWPLHPVLGATHETLIARTLELASELGVSKIVSMSGSAGDGPGASTVTWVWYPWPRDAVAFGRRSWAAAVDFWGRTAATAERLGIRQIAFELHPLHVVYNVPTLTAFRAEVGSVIGANIDPSHLFWQGMDPIAVIQALGPAVFHVHLKDTEINQEQVALAGVLDDRPFDNPLDRAWTFRTVGRVHSDAFWAAFVVALADAGYDDSLSIEQEDPYAPQEEGVREAAAYAARILAEVRRGAEPAG